MPWAKLDDGFFRHPKAIAAGLEGRSLFVAALCYASSQLTDGHIIRGALRALGADAGIDDPEAAADRLVSVGLWEANGDDFIIHDYLAYNPTSTTVKQRRAANAQRIKDWRDRNAVSNGVTDALVTPLVTPPPSRTPPKLTSVTNVTVADADAPLAEPPPKAGTRGKSPRQPAKPGWVERHPFFQPLVAQFGRPGGSEWSLWGKELGTLIEKTNEVPPEATAKEIPRRVKQWPKVMGAGDDGTPIVLTISGFVKHWHLLGGSNGTGPQHQPNRTTYQPDPELKALVQQSLGRPARPPNDLPGL